MSANQAVKLWYGELLFSNGCCCCCCYGSCANDFKEENVDLTTNILCTDAIGKVLNDRCGFKS